MTGFGEIPLNWLILTSYKKKCLSLLYFCPYSPIPVLSISLFPYLCSFPYSCSIPSSCSIPVPIPPFFLYPLFQPYSCSLSLFYPYLCSRIPAPFQSLQKIKHNASHYIFLASVGGKICHMESSSRKFQKLEGEREKKHKVYIMCIKTERRRYGALGFQALTSYENKGF